MAQYYMFFTQTGEPIPVDYDALSLVVWGIPPYPGLTSTVIRALDRTDTSTLKLAFRSVFAYMDGDWEPIFAVGDYGTVIALEFQEGTPVIQPDGHPLEHLFQESDE